MQILLEHHGRLTPSDCQSVLEDKRLQTCSLWGSSPCSGSRSRAQSPQLGSPWAPPSSATPTLSHLATPEVAILIDADTINNNNAQMMRLLLERIRALSPGLVWRWLGGAGRQAGAGRGGRRGSAELPIDLCRRPSLPLTPTQPPTTHPQLHPSQNQPLLPHWTYLLLFLWDRKL